MGDQGFTLVGTIASLKHVRDALHLVRVRTDTGAEVDVWFHDTRWKNPRNRDEGREPHPDFEVIRAAGPTQQLIAVYGFRSTKEVEGGEQEYLNGTRAELATKEVLERIAQRAAEKARARTAEADTDAAPQANEAPGGAQQRSEPSEEPQYPHPALIHAAAAALTAQAMEQPELAGDERKRWVHARSLAILRFAKELSGDWRGEVAHFDH